MLVKGQFSAWVDVLSGIPQGSVLGPILFVLYINDLPDNMISEVFMFADNRKMFREIRSNEDIHVTGSIFKHIAKSWRIVIIMVQLNFICGCFTIMTVM